MYEINRTIEFMEEQLKYRNSNFPKIKRKSLDLKEISIKFHVCMKLFNEIYPQLPIFRKRKLKEDILCVINKFHEIEKKDRGKTEIEPRIRFAAEVRTETSALQELHPEPKQILCDLIVQEIQSYFGSAYEPDHFVNDVLEMTGQTKSAIEIKGLLLAEALLRYDQETIPAIERFATEDDMEELIQNLKTIPNDFQEYDPHLLGQCITCYNNRDTERTQDWRTCLLTRYRLGNSKKDFENFKDKLASALEKPEVNQAISNWNAFMR
jgi:hypothetical protein